MTNPLVSITLGTKNEEKNLANLCETIKAQSYSHYELIIVDNNSSDKTKEIAEKYTSKVFVKGPERSTQRNFAVAQATGKYVFIPDADMTLSVDVLKECVEKMEADPTLVGIMIPETSAGKGFWAKCRRLEKAFYVGNDIMEAARFYKRTVFQKLNGFDSSLISGEDWDLSNRAKELGKLGRITAIIYHHDGSLPFLKSIKKKFYYGKHIANFTTKESNKSVAENQLGVVTRYKIFFSKPKLLFSNPVVGIGMLFLKTTQFLAVAIGMLYAQPSSAGKVILANLKSMLPHSKRLKRK